MSILGGIGSLIGSGAKGAGDGLGWGLNKAGSGLAWGGKQAFAGGQTFMQSWSLMLNKTYGLIDPRLGAAVGAVPGAAGGGLGIGSSILGTGFKGLLFLGFAGLAAVGLVAGLAARLSPANLARRVAMRSRVQRARGASRGAHRKGRHEPVVVVKVGRSGGGLVKLVVLLLLFVWVTPYTMEQVVNGGRRLLPNSYAGGGGVQPASCGTAERGGYMRLASDAGNAVHRAVVGTINPAEWLTAMQNAGRSVGHFLGAFKLGAESGTGLAPVAAPRLSPAQQVAQTCCTTAPGLPAGGVPASNKLPALTAEQVQVVQTTITVGLQRGVPTYGLVVALAAGNQESGLRNLSYGDRDSLGVWQERPSQGWGTPAQVMDVAYAAGAFFEHLAAVPGWEQMTVTQAAQAVERSAFPDAYADDEALARALVAQYTGGTVQTVAASCAQPTSLPAGPVAQRAIDFALAQLGKPYVWGSAPMPTPTGPVPATYDCSSLVDSAYLAAGVDLPGRQTTATLIALGTAVPFAQVQPGDLVFDDPGHVMLALGGGMVVEAPNSQSVVRTRAITGAWTVRRIVSGPTA